MDAVHREPAVQGRTPRLLVGAEGMYYYTHDGRKVLDGTAGLWCVNAGHQAPRIVKAIQEQAAELDYAPPFQMGHPKAFDLAARLTTMMPDDLDHVFFTNSGSESVDTALKIALAYHNVTGNGSRTRLIGREKGYHGGRLRRHLGRRHRPQPQVLRHPADRRRPSAAHP